VVVVYIKALRAVRLFLLVWLIPSYSLAEPLVTMSCSEPKGFRTEYGTSVREVVQAQKEQKPEPKPHLKGPAKDGYAMNPTFLVDSGKRKLTIIWSESAADAKAREEARELGMPYRFPPVVVSEAEIILFSPDQIAALRLRPPDGADLYTFFSKLGTAFLTSQGFNFRNKNTEQFSVFTTCEYSWTSAR
jgi:hypothetical protein